MKLTVKKMGFLFLCAVAVPAAAEVDIGFTRMGFDEINSKRSSRELSETVIASYADSKKHYYVRHKMDSKKYGATFTYVKANTIKDCFGGAYPEVRYNYHKIRRDLGAKPSVFNVRVRPLNKAISTDLVFGVAVIASCVRISFFDIRGVPLEPSGGTDLVKDFFDDPKITGIINIGAGFFKSSAIGMGGSLIMQFGSRRFPLPGEGYGVEESMVSGPFARIEVAEAGEILDVGYAFIQPDLDLDPIYGPQKRNFLMSAAGFKGNVSLLRMRSDTPNYEATPRRPGKTNFLTGRKGELFLGVGGGLSLLIVTINCGVYHKIADFDYKAGDRERDWLGNCEVGLGF